MKNEIKSDTEILLQRTEELLQLEREKNLDIFNSQPSGIYRILVNANSNKAAWSSLEQPPYTHELANKRFCEILSVSDEDLKNNPGIIPQLVHPDDKASFIEMNVLANEKLVPFKWEGRMIVKGKVIWAHFESLPRLLPSGEVLWTGFLYDISESKRIEEALRESEEVFRTTFENSAVGKSITSINGELKANKSFCDILGYSESELRNLNWREITFQEDIASNIKFVEEILNGKYSSKRWEKRYIHKNGSIVWVDITTTLQRNASGKPLFFITEIIDITEGKNAELEMQLNSRRLNAQLNILQYPLDSVHDYLDFALNYAIEMTSSKLGYIYFYNEETKEFVLNSWSKEVMSECKIIEKQTVYQLEKTGLWGEVVRQRKPIVVNDFQSPHSIKKGYPEGHAPLHKYLTIPVIRSKEIVAVVAVANKVTDYNDSDIKQLGILMDIIWNVLEKNQANNALRESEEKFKKAFMTSPDAINITKLSDGMYVSVNEGFSRMLGYNYDETIGKTSLEMNIWVNVEDRNKLVTSLKENGYIKNLLAQFKRKEGGTIYGLMSANMIELNGEKHLISITRDVTEIRKSEEKLIESQKLLKEITDNSASLIYALDTKGCFTLINKSLEKVFNQNRVELIGKKREDFMPIEIAEAHRANDLKVIETMQPITIEEENVESDGIHTYLSVKFPLVDLEGNLVGVSGISTDITERRKAENSIRKSKDRLNRAEFASKSGNWELLVEEGIIKASKGAAKVYGLKREEFNYSTIKLIPVPEYRNKMNLKLKNLIEKDEPYNIEFKIRKADTGEIKDIHSTAVYDKDRKIVFGVIQDITEQKIAEKALRESEQKLSALFTGMSEMTVIHKMVFDHDDQPIDYRIIDCNQSFTHITGILSENAIDRLATEVYETEQAPYLKEYAEVCRTGKNYEFKTYFPPMDKHFLVSVVSIGENRFATITADITEIQKAQEKVQEKNKELENYIYVASHDLRSPLVNIQGFSQRLQKQTKELKLKIAESTLENEAKVNLNKIANDEIPKSLDYILSNATKMDILIKGLLQVSRIGRVEMLIKKIDMNKLFKTILTLSGFELSEIGAEVNVGELTECYGDENQLNQLFSNIIGNAIKYRNKDKKLEIRITSQIHYNKAVYSISDNGIGISTANMEKIWNVFYRVDASKPDSGEGIGLSVVKKIAEKHKGKVWAESKEGIGTIFNVELLKNKFEE